MKVNEIFGPTIQGEGPIAGQRCLFLRLMGCNLDCTWCDTPYTWNPKYDLSQWVSMSARDVLSAMQDAETHRLIITGGEPLLQQNDPEFLRLVSTAGLDVWIETNGTITPNDSVVDSCSLVVSPKLSNAKVTRYGNTLGVDPDRERVWFKFVVQDRSDVDEVARWVQCHRIDRNRVFCMLLGTTEAQILHTGTAAVVDHIIDAGFNVSLRSHILIWGNERGR